MEEKENKKVAFPEFEKEFDESEFQLFIKQENKKLVIINNIDFEKFCSLVNKDVIVTLI